MVNAVKNNLARATNAIGKGERTEGHRSMDASGLVSCGEFDDFRTGEEFLFHVYRIAQGHENATIFFAIVESIFVDVFSNERFIPQVGTALA